MTILLYTLLLLTSILCLWKGADWVVESAAALASTIGISELAIGLTVVAFGTSAPEFAVTIGAAIKGHSDISVANIVGSNIFNLGFILGGIAAFRTIKTQSLLVYRDGGMLILTSGLILLFLWDRSLSRPEGMVLILVLVTYLLLLFYQREKVTTVPHTRKGGPRDVLFLVIGLGLVVLGGHWLVDAASTLARLAGISEWVIGVTIVAAGTSAPEFFTSIVATMKGRHGISAGNLVGSDLFNMLGVLGLAGVLHPLSVEPAAIGSLIALVAMIILVVVFMRTRWRLSRTEGILLIAINLVRWYLDFHYH